MKKLVIFIFFCLYFANIASAQLCNWHEKDIKVRDGKAFFVQKETSQQILNGVVCGYHWSGELRVTAPYVNGAVNGTVTFYKTNGEKLTEHPYVNGNLHGWVYVKGYRITKYDAYGYPKITWEYIGSNANDYDARINYNNGKVASANCAAYKWIKIQLEPESFMEKFSPKFKEEIHFAGAGSAFTSVEIASFENGGTVQCPDPTRTYDSGLISKHLIPSIYK